MNQKFIQDPNSLSAVLQVADLDDLNILVDYITDKGEGRISLDSDNCKRLVNCKNIGRYSDADRDLISYEIRRFGGNTLANWYRDARNAVPLMSFIDDILPDASNTVSYQEIVRDVAKHLDVATNEKNDVPTMEDGILRKLLVSALEEMTPEEQKQILEELKIKNISMLGSAATGATIIALRMTGFAVYKVALIVANAIAKAILGKGLTFAGNAMLVRTLSVALGPIGWIITGLWTAADMASPAYRVTVPCVVQVAYIRQKALMAINASSCPHCGELNAREANFCSECGKPMSA